MRYGKRFRKRKVPIQFLPLLGDFYFIKAFYEDYRLIALKLPNTETYRITHTLLYPTSRYLNLEAPRALLRELGIASGLGEDLNLLLIKEGKWAEVEKIALLPDTVDLNSLMWRKLTQKEKEQLESSNLPPSFVS
jgi:hypothetical protein